MTSLLIAKTPEQARSAKMQPNIVLCPEDPRIEGATWYATLPFTEPHLDQDGTLIEAAERRRIAHVARIKTLGLTRAIALPGTEPIAILCADVTPPDGWQETLLGSLKGNVRLVSGCVPHDEHYLKAWSSLQPLVQFGREVIMEPRPFDAAACSLDCCVIAHSLANSKGFLPFAYDLVTDLDVGIKAQDRKARILLDPAVVCQHG